ncbi:butyrophilin-like protein 2 [Corythoichthys intestinalis]|uniref:butyrophilin-like protein 2 n=1 Tax=Corythoichthys intestinalis TaxID=161448 RepID=UPI0025A51140|nr:butyrophilin-like protein 2 [Corythoichthys intestinalis]
MYQSKGGIAVHSFYDKDDQLAEQNERFRGRTSLFKQKIKEGNTSLLLKNVAVGDEGEYWCTVANRQGLKESFIQLHVETPVRTIQIQKVDNQLICSSEGIYPEPELHWSTEPTLPHALSTKVYIHQEWQTQLYGIKGSLEIPGDSEADVKYICDIRSSRSSKRATWRKSYRDVWCRWNTSCLLEASFPIGDDVIIHWTHQSKGGAAVHSFYKNNDKLTNQTECFRGRTSLFKEKIKEGNASLLLKNVVVGDEGMYRCSMEAQSNYRDSFIQVHVESPVTTIQITKIGKQLMCTSKGIFPEPQLRWFTEPALEQTLTNVSTIHQEMWTKLYSINSSIDLMGDMEYICEISCFKSSKRITWKETRKMFYSSHLGADPYYSRKVGIGSGVLAIIIIFVVVPLIVYYAEKKLQCCHRVQRTTQERTSEDQPENVPLREGVNPILYTTSGHGPDWLPPGHT